MVILPVSNSVMIVFKLDIGHCRQDLLDICLTDQVNESSYVIAIIRRSIRYAAFID